MKTLQKRAIAQLIIMTMTTGALVLSAASAEAKSLTCYKGAQKKVVTTSKCPTGWSSKKVSAAPAAPVAGGVAIDATYKGKITLQWSSSDVKVTSVTGTGSGTTAGLGEFSGSGFAAPTEQCAPFEGTGTLGSGADTIKMKVEPSSRACADNDAAPATINVTGKAIITGGTGKYAKASGTLKASGNFYVKAMTAGSTDSPSFTMSLSGTIATK